MKNFMSDMRSEQHGLNIPDLPFVIGELGMHGTDLDALGLTFNPKTRVEGIRTAQANAAAADANTKLASTKEILGVCSRGDSNQYHYFNNAKFVYEIGVAMGRRMLELLGLS